MPHTHPVADTSGHTSGVSSAVATARLPRRLVLVVLALSAAATVWGLVALWPSGGHAGAAYSAPGVTYPHGIVVSSSPPCAAVVPDSVDTPDGVPPAQRPGGGVCGRLTVRLVDGTTQVVDVPAEVSRSGLRAGDSVSLMKIPDTPEVQGAILDSPYSFVGIDRPTPLWVLTIAFVVLVLAVAWARGFAALVGLGVGGAVLLKFVAPALLAGESPVLVAVVGSMAIMFVVLYLTHGISMRTSTALVGTIVGVGVTALVGEVAVDAARLTGVSDENGGTLQALAGSISLHGIVTAGIIIAGLGVLNDVTITQTSAVWELRAAGPGLGRRALFGSAMRIGRDHLASTVYTIVFAYVGGALPIVLLVALYNRSLTDLFVSEDVTTEVIRTLSSAIGLVLAIPVTTAIAVATVEGRATAALRGRSPRP